MARSADSFRRGNAKYKTQPRTLIVCEDSKSCLDYLSQAARHFRSFADVEVSFCGKTDPIGIVNEAASKRSKFDRVYCAIDRDSHHGFEEALRIATAKDVEIIASYPCYEFWLLLHFDFARSPYASAGGRSAAEKLVADLQRLPGMAKYAKGETRDLFATLLTRLPTARTHASRALDEAIEVNEMNPSTRIHVLLDHLEHLGKPEPV